MNADIKAYDNPVKAVAEPEPMDLCSFCAVSMCPKSRAVDVAWTKDGRRVKGCDAFVVKGRKPLLFVLRVLMCMAACVAISQPFSVWLTVAGSVVAVACWQAVKAVERQGKSHNMPQT